MTSILGVEIRERYDEECEDRQTDEGHCAQTMQALT